MPYAGQSLEEFSRGFCPWRSQSVRAAKFSSPLKKTPVRAGFWTSAVFLNPNWNSSYFHWHRNFLPNLAFLLAQGFVDIQVILSDTPPQFQLDSLRKLGLPRRHIFHASDVLGSRLEAVLYARGVDRQRGADRRDYVSARGLVRLATTLLSDIRVEPAAPARKLYVRRGDVLDRRVVNETEVEDFLVHNGGYEVVDTGSMSYDDQIQLFTSASHVVGSHGGALTNVLFSKNVSVLELAASGHGLRPDFFPFARAGGGHLALLELRSENVSNDIEVPLELLAKWLAVPKLRSNFVLTLNDLGILR